MEQKESVAIIQSKLILLNDKSTYDIVGSFWTFTTMLYYFGSYGTVGEYIYEKELDVYTVKGAAVLIRKSVVDNIGLFDDDYWCYFEETDFCHRALLSGYEVKYVPLSPIYHAGGGSSLKFENSFVQYHNFKNKLCTYLKNFEFRRLTYVVPIHIVIVLFLSLYYLGGDRQKSLAMIKSLWWNVKNIRETYKKRKIVQNHRKRNDKDYLKKITINPKLYYYYCLLTNIKKYAKLY
jgi:GT2 family glycosyltransferase